MHYRIAVSKWLLDLYVYTRMPEEEGMKFICNRQVTAFPWDLARFNLDMQLLRRSFQVALLLNSPR